MAVVWFGSPAAFIPRAEAAPPIQLESRFQFSADFYRVSEGDGDVTITVVRTGDASREASVRYLADEIDIGSYGCISAGLFASATPGEDYTQSSGTLRFAAGETSKTFLVSVKDDAVIESRNPETVFLSLDFTPTPLPTDAECYGASATLFIHDNDPMPSPTPTPAPTNKRKIAFGSNRDGNEEIYVMDEDGTAVRRVTNTLSSDGQPSWSPDGTRLAFVSDREVRNGIHLMNADGTNVTRLPGIFGESPIWSPDGTRIAFTGSRQGFSYEIHVVNLDGSGLVNVSNNPQEDFAPAWSPDGKQLAYTSRRENGTFSVYVVNVDGTGLRRLVEGYSREPAWSPDGTRIAYVAQGDQMDTNIYVVNTDGTGKKFLTGGRPFNNDVSPSWSSDGARIAFVSNRDNQKYEIYVMNSDGSGQTRLTNDIAHDTLPVWQPHALAPPSPTPVLLTEPNTSWAVALDSVTQVAAPFTKPSANFSTDGRIRVSLFAAGVASPSASDIVAEAEDAAGKRYQLAVEHVAPLPGVGSMIQVIVRIPVGLEALEYVWVNLNVRGTATNKAIITLKTQ
jgi:TolB protein